MKKSNLIISSIIILFVIFSMYLGVIAKRQENFSGINSWWATYFSDPKSSDLSFVIENNGSKESFSWEITSSSTSLSKGKETIESKQKKLIRVAQTNIKGKVKIVITTQNGKKEIYKNL